MRGWVLGIAATCLCAATLGTSPARADGGEVRFSGGIYAPTCGGMGDGPVSGSAMPLVRCGGPAGAASGQVSGYALDIVPIERGRGHGNALVDYFAGYLDPAQRTHTQLVTRTYR